MGGGGWEYLLTGACMSEPPASWLWVRSALRSSQLSSHAIMIQTSGLPTHPVSLFLFFSLHGKRLPGLPSGEDGASFGRVFASEGSAFTDVHPEEEKVVRIRLAASWLSYYSTASVIFNDSTYSLLSFNTRRYKPVVSTESKPLA